MRYFCAAFLSLFIFQSEIFGQTLADKLDSLYLAGEYSSAENLIHAALSTSPLPDSSRAGLYLQLGIFTQELGKYSEAEDAYLRAEKYFASSDLSLASVLSHLSVLYSEQGRFADAKRAAERQFQIYRTAYGKEHPYAALASVVLAMVQIPVGNIDSAGILLNDYSPIIIKNFGEKSKEVSRLYEAEGRVAFEKKNFLKAEEYFLGARKSAANTPGDKHPLTARIALALARTELVLGNIDSASSCADDALRIALRASGPSHPFTAECLIAKGCIEEASGKTPAAFDSYQKAIAIYKEAVKENFRYTSERERLAFIRNVDDELSRMESTVLRTALVYPNGAGVFYNGLLFQKGIVLSSLEAMRRTAISSGDLELKNLLDKLAQTRTRLSGLLSGKARIEKPFITADSLRDESNFIEKELARHSQAFRGLEALGAVSWKDIRAKLQSETVCIELSRFSYYDGERKTDSAFYAALTVDKNDSLHPHLAIIGTAQHLEDTSLLRQYFRSLERHTKKKNQILPLISELLWSPLEQNIPSGYSILFSPDGIYHELSLAALQEPDGRSILAAHHIANVASTADVLENYPLDAHSVSIFADPDYESGELEELPGTLKEAQEIEKAFSDANWKVDSFLKSSATEEHLKNIRHPAILHIATHGKFSASYSDPDRLENSLLGSCLYLSGANAALSDPAKDGIFTALEAMDLDLEGTDLVTLSACESGKGIIEPGEGAFGLARAFRTAGAKNILMSLWQVPDKETKELMVNFYKNILNNQTKSDALRNAQLAERDIVKKRYGDDIPYFWAGFVLIGY